MNGENDSPRAEDQAAGTAPMADRRGELRPAVLSPARSRLSDWTIWVLFRLGDGAALVAVAVAASALQSHSFGPKGAITLGLETAVLIWSLHAVGLYDLGARSYLWRRWLRVAAGFALGWTTIEAIGLVLDAPTSMLFSLGFVLELPVILALHGLWHAMTWRWRRRGRLTPNIVVVGATEGARRLISAVGASGEAAVLGVFDDRADRSPPDVAGVKVLGDLDHLLAHRLLPFVDTIVIAVPARAEARIRHLIDRLSGLPNEIMLLIDHDRGVGAAAVASRLSSGAMRRVSGGPSDERRALVKRLQDMALGSVALGLAAPVMIATAIAVRMDSPGPALFRQGRHGFNNEEIVVLKFRSMRAGIANIGAGAQVTAGDERVTRVGRFIRRTSLDELPQLLNVLSGEMSLVGPRPHAVGMRTGESESAKLVAGYAHRHRIKPGITGWAAIHGSRGPLHSAAEIQRRVALDVEYIERQSFWLDLWILIATVPRLVGDRGRVR